MDSNFQYAGAGNLIVTPLCAAQLAPIDKVIRELQRQKMAMMLSADMPWAMRSGAGGASAGDGSRISNVQADQASPSMVQPRGIKQKASSSDISTMPSRPTLMCRPDKVWTAPVPGGALTRTFTGLGGFRFSGSLWCFRFSASLW